MEPAELHHHIQVAVSVTGTISAIAATGVLSLPLIAEEGPATTMQHAMVAVLATFNLLEAILFAIGRGPVPAAGDAPSAACVAQGSLMQFFSSTSFLWILYFVYALVRSVSGSGKDLLRSPAKKQAILPPLVATCLLALASCVWLGAEQVYGDATLWCWVSEPAWGIYLYYIPLVIIWACALVGLAYVGTVVRRRIKLVQREVSQRNRATKQNMVAGSIASSHGSSARLWGMVRSQTKTSIESAQRMEAALEKERVKLSSIKMQAACQLSAYLFVFVLFSTFGLANRLRGLIDTETPTPEW